MYPCSRHSCCVCIFHRHSFSPFDILISYFLITLSSSYFCLLLTHFGLFSTSGPVQCVALPPYEIRRLPVRSRWRQDAACRALRRSCCVNDCASRALRCYDYSLARFRGGISDFCRRMRAVQHHGARSCVCYLTSLLIVASFVPSEGIVERLSTMIV